MERLAYDATLDKWRISRGTVDVIGRGLSDFYPGNGRYVDLDGSTRGAGLIRTRALIALETGASYRIGFRLGVNGTAAGRLRFGFAGVATFGRRIEAGGLATLRSLSRTFVAGADGSFRLFFRGFGSDNRGPVIDAVSVERLDTVSPTRNVAPVPAPAAGLVLMSALAVLAMLRRRRRGA